MGLEWAKKLDGIRFIRLRMCYQVENTEYTTIIVVGFNVRHHLIPMNQKCSSRRIYKEEIQQERGRSNATLRELERKIDYWNKKITLGQ